MKVQSIMTSEVFSCRPEDSLELAARLLWEHDCGSLPVLDAAGRVHAVITDRDICMCAYTTGQTLSELKVKGAMSRRLITCSPGDSLEEAASKMREHALRRLPVVDSAGALRGVLSLSDVVCRGEGSVSGSNGTRTLRVLEAVSQPRSAPSPKGRADKKEPERAAEIRPAARAPAKGKRKSAKS